MEGLLEDHQRTKRANRFIDGHNDLPIWIRSYYHNRIYGDKFTNGFVHGFLSGHVDLPRLSQGQVGGTFWSVYVPCPQNGTDFSDDNYASSESHVPNGAPSENHSLMRCAVGVRQTMEQVDLVARLRAAYPQVFSGPVNGTTAMQAFQTGKIISPLGIEGLHSIGNSFAHLRNFYDLGVRYATLTHNCHNIYADAALVVSPGGKLHKSEPLWHGVSEAGRKLIHEMNRLGMIVDLAHVSVDTMRDVLGAGTGEWAGSRAPVIFSHSSAYAVCPHPRNVPDEVLQLVRDTSSLVMVNFAPGFISCTESGRPDGLPDSDPVNATLEHVADHIMHIGNLIGFDHVGLGSDFDGIESVPAGLEDVSKFPDLIEELLKRGVSDDDAGKVAGGNMLRVWREVDRVALEMQAHGALPVED